MRGFFHYEGGTQGLCYQEVHMRYMDQVWAWKEGCSGALVDNLE